MESFDIMLKVADVAKILNISKGQVYKMIKEDDTFPVIMFGKAIRIPKESLFRWVSKKEKK